MIADSLLKEAFAPWFHDIMQCFDTVTISNDSTTNFKANNIDDDDIPLSSNKNNNSKQVLLQSLKKISNRFINTTTDKALGCYALICRRWYMIRIAQLLSADNHIVVHDSVDTICIAVVNQLKVWNIKRDMH
jgi:hypothetical protein